VKQLRADDSADSRVKVGHRQALMPQNPSASRLGGFVFGPTESTDRFLVSSFLLNKPDR